MTLNAASLDTLLESYKHFARLTDIPKDTVTTILNSNQTTEEKIRSLRTETAARMEIYKNWLVIVDNVENLKLVSTLLPERRNDKWKGGQVLITTQELNHIPPCNSFTGHIEISPGMDEKKSCELLTKLSGNTLDSHNMLKKVAKELDYQPLALAAAGVYIQLVRATKVSPEFSWHDYLQKLDEGKRQLTEKRLQDISPAYPLTMTAAVLLAVEKAAENDVVLKHTFHFLSLASHESLPLEVAINNVILIDKNQDKEQVGLAIRKCCLILPDDEVNKVAFVRLHRVVHDAIKVFAREREREMAEICNSIELAAKSFFKYLVDGNNDRTLVPHLKSFHHAMIKIFPSSKTLYSENPSFEIGEIFLYLGDVLRRSSNFFSAKGFCAAAVEICEKQRGSNDENVALSYNSLGNVHQALGDLRQAKQYFEKALKIQIDKLGSKHVDISLSYNNLGHLHQELGDFRRAKQYHEKALDIQTEQLGPKHIALEKSYNNLGYLHQNLSDFQRAKQYHEKALDIHIEMLGPKHADVALSYNNLGGVHNALGNLQQAKQYYEKAMDIQTEQYGPKHVFVGVLYNNLGSVHKALGDLQQAKQYYEKALDTKIEQLGSSQHVSVAKSYNNLGGIYLELGNLQQAKQYYEKALDINTEQLGFRHVDVAKSYNNLGEVHQVLGNLQQAKQYYEKALDIWTEEYGPRHRDVAMIYAKLGHIHFILGNLQQAKQYLEKTIDISTELLGSDHVNVVICKLNLKTLQALENQPSQRECCMQCFSFLFFIFLSIFIMSIYYS